MTSTQDQKTATVATTIPKPRETKTEIVRRLLARKTGADLDALCKATGWQPHSVRAVLSGLRKAGFTLERKPPSPEGGSSLYRITAGPKVAA